MKLHQILITEDKKLPETFPDLTQYCINNVKLIFDDYDYHLYSGEELEEIIKNNFHKDVFISYNKLNPFCYRSDLARACLLYLYGGLYIDLHIQFIGSFNKEDLQNYDFCAFREGRLSNTFGISVNTSILYSKEKSLVLEKFIEKIIMHCKKEYYGYSPLYPTGPSCLGKAFHSVVNDENESKYALIGDFCKLTDVELGFVTNNGTLFALRKKNVDTISDIGLKGVNNYIEMYNKKNVYNKNVIF